MITIIKTDHPRVVGFKMSGKLKDEDYSAFVPQADKIVADAHIIPTRSALPLWATGNGRNGWRGCGSRSPCRKYAFTIRAGRTRAGPGCMRGYKTHPARKGWHEMRSG